jgi:hypothetical protein
VVGRDSEHRRLPGVCLCGRPTRDQTLAAEGTMIPLVGFGLHMPHDLGTWSFIISIAALILVVPLGIFTNMATPLFKNWLSHRSLVALKNRIAKLEAELAGLEQQPVISEAEEEILQQMRSSRLRAYSFTAMMIFLLFCGITAIAGDLKSNALEAYKTFNTTAMIFLSSKLFFDNYRSSFLYRRGPTARNGLRKQIDDLIKIRDHWGSPIPD